MANSRKKKGYCTKTTELPTAPHPMISSGTKKDTSGMLKELRVTEKQKEIMKLVQKKLSLSDMGRELNLKKNSISCRLDGVVKKKLVYNEYGKYKLTKLGKTYLTECTGTCSVVVKQKNIHSNEFTVGIKRLPQRWNERSWYFESLTAKDWFPNKASGQVYFEFEDCRIRIAETTLKATIWIFKKHGKSFNSIQSKVWDAFVKYFRLLKAHGFQLDNEITSPSPHFADPNGFFAMLSSYSTKKGFRIEAGDDSFWVDYSDGFAEEETSNEEKAKRMEQLSESAFKSESDFEDLDRVVGESDKLLKIVKNLVIVTSNLAKVQTTRLTGEVGDMAKNLKNPPDYMG